MNAVQTLPLANNPGITINRTGWPAGEWDSESDFETFLTEAGYPGQVLRMSASFLCGYARVPEDHPLFGKDYSDRVKVTPAMLENDISDISPLSLLLEQVRSDGGQTCSLVVAATVHGGLTFSGQMRNQEGWWFGFDAGHYQDLSPNYTFTYDGTYRNMAYMKSEVEKLATALKALATVELAPETETKPNPEKE